MSTWPTRTHPVHRVTSSLCAALVVVQAILPVMPARAHPTHPGKWTGTRNLGGTAVNLVLLPGGPSNYHSRVLWWSHDNDYPTIGDVIGWNAPDDAATNAGTFPALPNFKSMGLEAVPNLHGKPSNIFCSGQVLLADGRLLVTGGEDIGEAGNVSTLYFNAAADSNGSWTRTEDMAFRRWYDDNVLLPNSQVLTTSGSSYAHYLTVGGFADAAPDTQTRMLQRVGVAVDCTIEPSAVALKGATPALPLTPLSDATGLLVSSNRLLVYGGHNDVPAKTNAAYIFSRERNEYGADYDFRWNLAQQVAVPGQSVPDARVGATLVRIGNQDELLLIGGNATNGPEAHVWRGSLSNNTITWKRLNNHSGSALPARHGHGAVYDANVNRVFVFGGSGTAADAPSTSSSDVYSIELGSAGSDSMIVSVATVGGPNLPPAPKSYASLTHVPFSLRGVPGDAAAGRTRALLFGGFTPSGTLSDTLHAMWIYGANEVRWQIVPLDAGPARPSPRARHNASFDGNTHLLVLSGGDRNRLVER